MTRRIASLSVVAFLSAVSALACDKPGATEQQRESKAVDQAESARAESDKNIASARVDFEKTREDYRHTRFIDLADLDKKIIDLSDRIVNLILWDLAGEDDISSLRMSYLRGSAGYVLVADGTRPSTLEVAFSLRRRVEADFGPLPFVLLLNKNDLREQWAVRDEEVEELRRSGWWVQSTSARTGEGVEDAFRTLADRVAR